MLSVLFSEPRAGRFVAVDAWRRMRCCPACCSRFYVPGDHVRDRARRDALLESAPARRQRALRRRFRRRARRQFPAVVCLHQERDHAAGRVFYALAAYAGARVLFESMAVARLRPGPVAIAIALAVISTGSTVRAAGVPYFQRSQAFKHRGDWGSSRASCAAADARTTCRRTRDTSSIACATTPWPPPAPTRAPRGRCAPASCFSVPSLSRRPMRPYLRTVRRSCSCCWTTVWHSTARNGCARGAPRPATTPGRCSSRCVPARSCRRVRLIPKAFSTG